MTMSPELIAMISAVAGFLAVKIFDMVFDKSRRHDDRLQENTVAITTLQVEIKHLNERLADLYRLRHDMDAAHQNIRDLRKRVDASETR